MFKRFPGIKNLVVLKSHIVLLLALCGVFVLDYVYRGLDADDPTNWTDMLPADCSSEFNLKDKPAPIQEEPADERRGVTVDRRTDYSSQIKAAATANHVEPALIRAVISAESGNDASAVSRTGAVGLMQLMPDTAKRYHVTDRHDPEQNIHGGTQYLRDLLRVFKNDVHLAIAAYNAGARAVMKHGNQIPLPRARRRAEGAEFYGKHRTEYTSADDRATCAIPASQKKALKPRFRGPWPARPSRNRNSHR
jgi:hypothetical protein